MLGRLAWRNLWRNPRRTIVILTAIVIGLYTMVLTSSMSRGMVQSVIENGLATLVGNLQVHREGYLQDPVVENSIADPAPVEKALDEALPPGSSWTSRVRVNAIASNARHSTGVTLVGIRPEREAKVSFIGGAVHEGDYLEPGDPYGILVGRALLKDFETAIGHKLVLMSQDTSKQIASRAFRIVGVFDAEMESTEKGFVFVDQAAAREMLGLGRAVSEFSAVLPKDTDLAQTKEKIRAALNDPHLEVADWLELQPMLRAYVEIFDGMILIWYLVVFIAMGFGIINTTLMAVYERMREFGLLKALGMKPARIIRSVLTESLFLLLLGACIGNALGLLTTWLLSGGIDLSGLAAGAELAGMSRVIKPAIFIRDLVTANVVVILLGLLVSAYPAVRAARFTPVEAMART